MQSICSCLACMETLNCFPHKIYFSTDFKWIIMILNQYATVTVDCYELSLSE